jgi:hypothetical protein
VKTVKTTDNGVHKVKMTTVACPKIASKDALPVQKQKAGTQDSSGQGWL